MSDARHATRRSDSRTGFGYRPALTPANQLLREMGMCANTKGKRQSSATGSGGDGTESPSVAVALRRRLPWECGAMAGDGGGVLQDRGLAGSGSGSPPSSSDDAAGAPSAPGESPPSASASHTVPAAIPLEMVLPPCGFRCIGSRRTQKASNACRHFAAISSKTSRLQSIIFPIGFPFIRWPPAQTVRASAAVPAMVQLFVVRFSAIGKGNAPVGTQCSASGVIGRAALSGFLGLVRQTVRKPVCPETLSALLVRGLVRVVRHTSV